MPSTMASNKSPEGNRDQFEEFVVVILGHKGQSWQETVIRGSVIMIVVTITLVILIKFIDFIARLIGHILYQIVTLFLMLLFNPFGWLILLLGGYGIYHFLEKRKQKHQFERLVSNELERRTSARDKAKTRTS